ncbi:family 1 glycosylhydrolase [Microbacterium arborescens]
MSRSWGDGRLRFAVGIEDTFIPQEASGQRALDEYVLMQHDEKLEEDIALAAESGATMLRWGVPWYRVNPAPGVWEWAWLDRAVAAMEARGIELIADLVHYGTPLWLEGEFANPGYAPAVADYARAVARRYRGRIRYYTPANEPLLNAMYCGEFGHWPPYLSGHAGFVTLVKALSRGIVLTQQAIAEEDPDAGFVHVEASFRFAGDVAAHAGTVRHLSDRRYVIQDLVMGRVDDDHPMTAYLLAHGFSADDLAWARRNTAEPDVVGVNYYPQHSTEVFEPGIELGGGPGELRPRRNAGVDGLADVLRSYANRYRKPVFLTETGFTGTVAERIAWLEASVAEVERLRAEGLEVVGYTWWCVTDMIEWSYRYGDRPAAEYLLQMGLWGLVPDDRGDLQRVRTRVADRFAELSQADSRRTTR